MTKDAILGLVEDLLDSTLPLNGYHIIIDRDNGNSSLTMCRCQKMGMLDEMYTLSEIFNSRSQDWVIEERDGKLFMIIR